MFKLSDDLKLLCKASDILLLKVKDTQLDYDFISTVLDKSVIKGDKLQLTLISSDQETAVEE